MGIQYRAGSLRKYSMVSAFAIVAALGAVDHSAAASMDVYHQALAGGNAKATAVEAMRLLEEQSLSGGASAGEVMQIAEQLMTGAVATGDERMVKWVSAAILKGAGEKNFNAAELGIRVVVEGSRYQMTVSQISKDARELMNVSLGGAPVADEKVPGADRTDALAVTTPADRSFLAELFDVNRSSWNLSNRLSVGYDSNIYSNGSEEGGLVFRDSLNMSLSASSPRTAGQIFYKPTLTISPSKDVGDQEVYQDFVGLLSHEVSERSIVRFKDTFRLQEDEDLQTFGEVDNSFWKNTASVSLDRVMRADARLSLTATGQFKRYADSDQGEDKDYKLFSLGAQYSKNLSERTFSELGLNFSSQDYDSADADKGNTFMSATAGVNHQLNPDVVLYGAVGATLTQPDIEESDTENTLAPYFKGQATYYFSPKTTMSALVQYAFNEDSSSADSVGSQDLKFELSGRHSFTEKISVNSKIGHSVKTYEADYSRDSESETTYDYFSTKLTYKISRIHAVDAGYKFRATDGDTSGDYDRQQFDMGWTVKF